MNPPALRCVGLCRWYGEVQGLSGLDLEVEGGVVGLLGPNGAGKSTLMRLVTGLARPSRGFVEVFGQRMDRPGRHEVFRRVGYAPGEDVHFETERARDFLTMLAVLGGDDPGAARRRADAALELVGMEEFAAKRLDAMSKGMRQRIKLAQTVLFEPELLLLDEPLNGMDPVSRRRVMDLVRDWGREGRTVLFASHVLHEVEAVTDRVVLLHQGRLLAEGRLEEIREIADERPRRVELGTDHPREIAAEALEADLVDGVSFPGEDRLVLETRSLDRLLAHLERYGEGGWISAMEVEEADLESLFAMMVDEGVTR